MFPAMSLPAIDDLPDVEPVAQDVSQPASWTIERCARERTVIVAPRNQPPPLVRLTLDVRLTRFALGIERVEFQVEVMFGRLARVDRAA
jgi:hypothetical protein